MAKKVKHKKPSIIDNRRARRNYEVIETLEVGISLVGTEVKALREGRVSLDEAYVHIVGRGLVLERAHFGEYSNANINGHPALRPRALLAHKKEVLKLEIEVKQKGLTLIPMKMYFSGRWAKVEVALARGRTDYDKRQVMKERDAKRDIKRFL
ncbi:MAG: SsrA-binding protein [Myxococcota bacterium]|jgi:SsrA-binding protein